MQTESHMRDSRGIRRLTLPTLRILYELRQDLFHGLSRRLYTHVQKGIHLSDVFSVN
jgi:hypothetical protein